MTTFKSVLWYDKGAGQAARFYVSLFDDAELITELEPPTDPGEHADRYPSNEPLTVEWRLGTQHFVGLNGGPHFSQSEAFSIEVTVPDQAEVDRLWAALTTDGGQESQCGWLKDRWGVSWQIVPQRFYELFSDPDPEVVNHVMARFMTMTKLEIAPLEAAAAAARGGSPE